jgi:hypothetical protein
VEGKLKVPNRWSPNRTEKLHFRVEDELPVIRTELGVLRKVVEKEIDRSNAIVSGDDKIGSCVSW